MAAIDCAAVLCQAAPTDSTLTKPIDAGDADDAGRGEAAGRETCG
jgi:hypothetical protein